MTASEPVARTIRITVDERQVEVSAGVTVAAGLVDAGIWSTRTSVQGEPRGPLCGMGVCFECRVTIDGVPTQRACLVAVRDGMRVETMTASTARSAAR